MGLMQCKQSIILPDGNVLAKDFLVCVSAGAPLAIGNFNIFTTLLYGSLHIFGIPKKVVFPL